VLGAQPDVSGGDIAVDALGMARTRISMLSSLWCKS
jgi:hypothetical protein